MTLARDASSRWRLPVLSSEALLLGNLVLSLAMAFGLSAMVISEAAHSNRDLVGTIETRVLQLLERDGLSGLVTEIDRREGALIPSTSDVEFAVWRRTPDQDHLVRETLLGLATAVKDKPDGTKVNVPITDAVYQVFSPDIATISQGWDMAMSDIAVSFAIRSPTPRLRETRRVVAAVSVCFALAVLIGLIFHIDHRRRYRDGLDRINAVLEDFAAGDTSAQVAIETRAPELHRLSDHLCAVLPRFDRLLEDLRALNAHLAHELKTPLQTIRSDVGRLAASDEMAERRRIAREIDTTIDITDARLRSVMELFRLSADVKVPLDPNVNLSQLVTDQIYDFEDFLISDDRSLLIDISDRVIVTANSHLLDLLVANLLSNAAKYTPANATIGVELSTVGTGFILRVWNTDSAFPEDWVGKPFQRLTRGQEHRNIPGHGLGLALVGVIARHHGFTARIDNATDPGTGAPRAIVTVQGRCKRSG